MKTEICSMVLMVLATANVVQCSSLMYKSDLTTLNATFRPCYEKEMKYLPRTTDKLIDLIGKIETNDKLKSFSYGASDLATVLISRFRRDEIIIGYGAFYQKDDVIEYQKRLFKLIRAPTQNIKQRLNEAIDAAFSAADKCSMHLMLSNTYIGITDDDTKSTTKTKSMFRRAVDMVENAIIPKSAAMNNMKYQSYEEYGTLYNNYGTVFGGAVLAGIAASRSLDASGNAGNLKIKNIYGVTLANVIAKAVLENSGSEIDDNMFGSEDASWTNTNNKCKTLYTVKTQPVNPDPSIIGSLDGLILGTSVKNLENQGYTLRSMLQMYYGKADDFSAFAWACNRWNNKTVLGDHYLAEQSLAAAYYFNDIHKSQLPELNNKAYNYFKNNYIEVKKTETCPKRPTELNPVCQTNAEVVIVMDSVTTRKENALASTILSRIDTNGSTIGVYTNVLDQHDDLHTLACINNKNLTKTDVVCTAENYSPTKGASHKLSATVNAVNKFFDSKNKDRAKSPYLPPQVAIIFKKGIVDDTSETDKALRNLADYQPAVQVLMLGDVESLKDLPRENMFPMKENALKNVQKRICSVPGNLQYYYCNSDSENKEKEFIHTGNVMPSTVQYLRVDSKNFLSSSNVKITFELKQKYGVGNANIKISQGRKDISDSSEDEIRLNSARNKYTFEFKDPCGTYDEGECPPITFKITGISCNAHNSYCCKNRDQCLAPNEIQYYVTHEGFYCGSGWSITSSFVTLFCSFAALFITNQKLF